VELQNLKKMTDLLAENFENFWKNVVLRKIFRTCFSENISSTSPPQILDYTPPQSETGWHGPDSHTYLLSSVAFRLSKELNDALLFASLVLTLYRQATF
jgi:hypothetical protein